MKITRMSSLRIVITVCVLAVNVLNGAVDGVAPKDIEVTYANAPDVSPDVFGEKGVILNQAIFLSPKNSQVITKLEFTYSTTVSTDIRVELYDKDNILVDTRRLRAFSFWPGSRMIINFRKGAHMVRIPPVDPTVTFTISQLNATALKEDKAQTKESGVVLREGDIQLTYDKETDGTPVRANVFGDNGEALKHGILFCAENSNGIKKITFHHTINEQSILMAVVFDKEKFSIEYRQMRVYPNPYGSVQFSFVNAGSCVMIASMIPTVSVSISKVKVTALKKAEEPITGGDGVKLTESDLEITYVKTEDGTPVSTDLLGDKGEALKKGLRVSAVHPNVIRDVEFKFTTTTNTFIWIRSYDEDNYVIDSRMFPVTPHRPGGIRFTWELPRRVMKIGAGSATVTISNMNLIAPAKSNGDERKRFQGGTGHIFYF